MIIYPKPYSIYLRGIYIRPSMFPARASSEDIQGKASVSVFAGDRSYLEFARFWWLSIQSFSVCSLVNTLLLLQGLQNDAASALYKASKASMFFCW